MFSDFAIRNCGPSFSNSLDITVKHCKTTKHFRNQLKSILLSEYNWLHFGACLVYFCVLCLFCKVCFLLVSVYICWNLDFSQAFMAFWSCPQYHVVFLCLFVLMYNIGIKFDMIWYDMIWYDMIWYDMIWYDMIWYDMIWYDMIWYDMIWYDMMWCDVMWCDMITNHVYENVLF